MVFSELQLQLFFCSSIHKLFHNFGSCKIEYILFKTPSWYAYCTSTPTPYSKVEYKSTCRRIIIVMIVVGVNHHHPNRVHFDSFLVSTIRQKVCFSFSPMSNRSRVEYSYSLLSFLSITSRQLERMSTLQV